MLFCQALCFGLISMSFFSSIPLSFASGSDNKEESISYRLECKNENYLIAYHVTNASVTIPTTQNNENIVLSIINSSNGIITIVFPRQYVDMKIGNTDDRFVVLGNGEDMSRSVIDTSNSTHRILTIPLTNGNFQLHIISGGTPEDLSAQNKDCTLAIPEFGTIVYLILIIGFVSIIVVYTKSRFRSLVR